MVVDLIKRDFGGGPTVPRPAPRDVGVKATAGPRAIVATDSELTRAEVSIVRIEPPREPVTTAALKRRELVDLIGAWTFSRRMNAEIAAGKVAFLGADASVSDWPGTMRMTGVEASGRPGTWRAMLTELGTALQRARLHGFSEREVEDAPPGADRPGGGGRAARGHAPGARGAAPDQRRGHAAGADHVGRPVPRAAAAACCPA